MTRRHPKSKYSGFDRVVIDEPEYAAIRRFVSEPRKTIFVNAAADPDGITVKLTEADDDLFDFAI